MMRIEAYNQIQKIYTNNTRVNKAASASKSSPTDGVQISKMGQDILSARKAVSDAPDIRSEVVEPLKQQIQAGSYDVSVDDFADKLLQNFGS